MTSNDTRVAPESPKGTTAPPQPDLPSKRNFRLGVALVLALMVGGALLGTVVSHFHLLAVRRQQAQKLPSLASSQPIQTNLANFMGLSPAPGTAAPGFTLVDQQGKPVSMSQFRGKVVALEFMDTKCTDICPIISQEFVDAYHDLGAKASNVVFLGVNVNAANASVADVASFTSAHGLSTIPNWYFLTGSPAALKAVWNAYGVQVQIDPKNGTVLHSNPLYFIGPHGHERYVATPYANMLPNGTGYLAPSSISRWGKGIAQYSAKMLP
ncbi:MAG: SCO family protein [Actinomycetota bacterium]|nr:SCO family protein [Actinomycetota bacterium]